MRNCLIEGAGLATVAFAEDFDLGRELGEDFRGPISRTVIDNDSFAEFGGIVLGENAVQRLLYEAFVIVGVDENADQRLWH